MSARFAAKNPTGTRSANCLSCWLKLNDSDNCPQQFRSPITQVKSTCSACRTFAYCFSHTAAPTKSSGARKHNCTQRLSRLRQWRPSIKSPSPLPNHARASRHRLHFQGHRRRSIAGDWSSYIHAASDRMDSSSCLSSGWPHRRRHVLDFDDQEDEREVECINISCPIRLLSEEETIALQQS